MIKKVDALFCVLLLFFLLVDVWSVGCILAELLTGRVLFFGKNCILMFLKNVLLQL